MKNIVLIRIDDRLIHGQVVVDKGYKRKPDSDCGR